MSLHLHRSTIEFSILVGHNGLNNFPPTRQITGLNESACSKTLLYIVSCMVDAPCNEIKKKKKGVDIVKLYLRC